MDMVSAKTNTNFLDSFAHSTVVSKDGTTIGYQSIGKGPSLILIHGALSTSNDFTKFARELSDSFRVHVMDRRGRGGSGPQGIDYSIKKECEDVRSLQEATGATYVFGHSYGGLVTLEAARTSTFKKMAVYEPGVSMKSIPTDWDWLPEYENDMNKKDFRGAFASFVRGSGHTPLKRLPKWYAKFILRLVIRGNHWNQIENLLPENLIEHREVKRLESTFPNYQMIDANVLLIAGGKSPDSVHQMIRVLDETISRTQTLIIPNLDHLAPDNKYAPVEVAQHVKRYFLS
ncbi:alpha/beta fold hydrolase [Paenibacillus sp. LMG 31460]|uniref:Alpha/beta fold hydrolase n=2 Tax=Paenibacillus germinis TaxID=2654979 RepID=A0ABX1Z3R1_9BACL|nr:alpha/beta fold hydrolase [Paenibacillus germinis]